MILMMNRFSGTSRNGSSRNGSNVTWLSTTERRSLMGQSPTQNGAIKETLIPDQMTTNVDDSITSKKPLQSIGNATLRIGFVHHSEDANLINSPAVVSAGLVAPSVTSGLCQQQSNTPSGILYRNSMEHRHTKPIEWRINLANVKVC